MGFKMCTSDFSLFFKQSGTELLLILVYVDDILVCEDDQTMVLSVIDTLKTKLNLKHMEDVHYFLGIEVVAKGSDFVLCQH